MSSISLVIFLALAYGFMNGFLDSGSILATPISSRSLSPKKALILITISEFCGPLFFGTAVAKSISSGVAAPEGIPLKVITAALVSTLFWGWLTWLAGIPSSSTHALVGGLVGAVVSAGGWGVIYSQGLIKILVILLLTPMVGLAAGFLVTKLIYFLARNASMRINWFFRNAQILTGIFLGISHGANDSQKTMGLIMLILLAEGNTSSVETPIWIRLLSAGALALGVSGGGRRVIRTLGSRIYKVRPVNGFATQLTAACVITSAALIGSPVSTTQIISSAILGAGSAERINKVRWGVAGQILIAWFLTIPATGLLAAGVHFLMATLN